MPECLRKLLSTSSLYIFKIIHFLDMFDSVKNWGCFFPFSSFPLLNLLLICNCVMANKTKVYRTLYLHTILCISFSSWYFVVLFLGSYCTPTSVLIIDLCFKVFLLRSLGLKSSSIKTANCIAKYISKELPFHMWGKPYLMIST